MSAESGWVFNVGEGDFEALVEKRSGECPVVVDFWAPWCGPCKVLGPTLEKKVEARGGAVLLAKVNVEEAPQLAERFQVQSIPLVVAFRGGKPIDQFIGVLSDGDLDHFLDGLQPSEIEAAIAEAEPLKEIDPERAAELYEKALVTDPGHERALVGLAEIRFSQGVDAEAVEALLARTAPGGECEETSRKLRALLYLRAGAADFPAVNESQKAAENTPEKHEIHFQLGSSLAAAGKYPEALASLLEAAKLNKPYAREKVRDAMVQIFYVVGVRSPLADDYRAKLASALY